MLIRRYQGTLAAALVVSLLICNGLASLGHPHHGGVEDAAPSTAAAHASTHPPAMAGDGNLAGHHAGGFVGGILDCYVSVLLTVAIGMAVRRGPALDRFSAFTETLAPPRWYPTGDVLRRSRAPDQALLEVFLL